TSYLHSFPTRRSSDLKQLFEVDIDMITIASSVIPRFFKPLANPSALIPTLVHLLDSLLVSIAAHDRISQIDSNLLIETKKVLNRSEEHTSELQSRENL